ncbi:hypothetical protein AOQ84DRAFT_391549 [Glonium stellatum]|uniref:Uncharacterized protein n=1 Tax=Glonium stellatum TaxID=574774 RepID=A0A8E2ETR5_9PEZI|nr:hypothetical protein AOQ84DRAFT_391549 [Glonium stellatum]
MAPIFSSDDVHDLIHLFPLEIFQNDTHLNASRNFAKPFLLPSHSGDGFLVSSKLLKKFREIVRKGKERIPISSLSHQLDIGVDVALDLVNQSRYDTILSGDKHEILTKSERDLLWDKLWYTCSQQFLSISDFSYDNNICLESIHALSECTKSEREANADDDHLLELNYPTDKSKGAFLCSSNYRRALDHSILGVLQTAHGEAKPVLLRAQSFSGLPPLWYISKVVKDALNNTHTRLGGNVENNGEDQLLFTPRSLFVQRRDEIISKLQAGDAPYADLSWFTEEAPEIYHSMKDAETYIQKASSNNIIFHSGYSISKVWVDNDLTTKRRQLDKVGYTDLSATLINSFPDEVLSELITLQKNRLLDPPGDPSASLAALTTTNYVVQTEYNNETVAFIRRASRDQADAQWAKLGPLAQQECMLQESEIYDDFLRKNPDNQRHLPVFKAIFQEIESDAKSAFSEQLARLEAENEADFSAFWVERVTSRFQIYKSGAEAIDDVKLRTQLLELLVSYTVKELVPDTLSRAQSKGLLRSKKTRRHTQKLRAALSAPTGGGKEGPDLNHVITALEKFMKQQSLEWSNAANLAEKKSAQIRELVRGMQKDKDGPRLFLTLIVVLLANKQEGIIYATGKLAPKLMRLLKGRLGAKGYERVEVWKDAVKAGKLTAEDQEEMKLLATSG